MNKDLQDQAWRSLPSETRKAIHTDYADKVSGDGFYDGFDAALKKYFGHHNLTSDEEYPEMLSMSREFAQSLYAQIKMLYGNEYNEYTINALIFVGIIAEMERQFGSKCLPDESDHELGQTPVQVDEPASKPASEPASEEVEPTETKTNEDMEETELNLAEILKGHEGEKFFDFINGDVVLDTINNPISGGIDFHTSDGNEVTYTDPWLIIYKSGSAIVYPSCDLYLKYPLDARAAWMEWIEANRPKRWRAEKGENYWTLDWDMSVITSVEGNDSTDGGCYKCGNYFRTQSDAQQAADLVRETLTKFHESKMDKE